jgi:dCMP deaminase
VKIVGVDVKKSLLVERILSRARDGDAIDKKEVLKKIEREEGKKEPPEGQQVAKCMKLVDITIKNEGTLDEFKKAFVAYYETLAASTRPSKDEYYMDLAKSVCRRSTCLKVEIGAVIIRDDQVVATGYCGAPRGTKSSQGHGFCLRVKLGIPSGHRYEMCRSVHAEQNAIINAARAGTSLLGGDMYIYGKRCGNEPKVIDAFPCFICKKMLINCGLKRVICSLADGGVKIFTVDEWIAEWGENDIIDDKFQYGVKTNLKA